MATTYTSKEFGVPWWVSRCIKDHSTDIFTITGGLGSAKTTGAAIWFIDRWLFNNESKFSWAIAPTMTKCEQIILPALRQILFDIYGMRDGIEYRIYKGRLFKLVIKGYQHEIHLLSGDRPQLFVGSNVASVWITEPGLMNREVYEKSQNRLRCPRAKVRQILLEGTPEDLVGKGEWWAELADIPGVGFDRRDEQRNIRRIILETTFNRHLKPSPEEYAQKKIRDVYSYDPGKIQSYEKGLFVPFSNRGMAYPEFIESRNVCAPTAPTPNLPIYFCWDFNASPLAWVAAQKFWTQDKYHSPRREKVIGLKESSGESRGLMDAVAEFAAKFPVSQYANTLIEVHGDASGWAKSHKGNTASDYANIEDYLRSLGYRNVSLQALRSNPIIRQRLEKVAALMAYEYVAVTSECKKTITGFRKTALKEGTWDIEKPSGDDWTHYPDAFTYGLFKLYKNTDVVNPGSRVVGTTI